MYTLTAQTVTVPEPGSAGLLVIGLLALGPMQVFPLLPCNNPRRNTSMNYLADDDPRLWDPLDFYISDLLRGLPGRFRDKVKDSSLADRVDEE